MIEVAGFSKAYDGLLAVDGVSFHVPGGEIWGLVGPNGAGKTTTLRALAGVLPPSGGRLAIAGHDVVREPLAAKRRLALVADEPQLFGALTVREHLDFTARVYGVAEWEPAAERLLAELELTERLDSLADELSRGMRQKVAVACALLHDPAVLLMDEPLTGLDPRGIRTLYGLVRRQAERGSAVVLSTHLLGQVEGLCTGFLILHRGRLLYAGGRDELRARFPVLGPGATLEEIFFHVTETVPPEGA
jgi:ABC-2 type transport system ATP-binding protein